MIITKQFLTYALNASKELVYVKDVPTRDACGCVCPYCGEPLCAKNAGKKKTPHFAHVSGADCPGAYESALHLLAKTILAEGKVVMTPEFCLNHESYIIQFDDVKVEECDDELNLRPDCIGSCKGQKYWIEFRNAHEVTAKKITEVVSKKIDCLEIDLRECKLDRDEVKKFIETSIDNRRWIYSNFYINNGVIMNEDALYQRVYHSAYDSSSIQRHFAVDGKGEVVNLTDIASLKGLDMISNPCYCLSCGKPLYLNMDAYDGYYFEHQEYNPECEDRTYLLKLAKLMLIRQYRNRPGFLLKMPIVEQCWKTSDCQFFDKDSCFILKDQLVRLSAPKYKLKEDSCIQHDKMSSESLFLKTEHHEIHFNISINNSDKHTECIENTKHHMVNIYVCTEKDALELEDIVFTRETMHVDYHNFKFQSPDFGPKNRMLFSVLSSGEYHLSTLRCLIDRTIPPATIFEIIFTEILNRDDAKRIGLKYCLDNDIPVCLCEICYLCSKDKNGPAICRKYKTSQNTSTPTPHYPLNAGERPVACPFFSLLKEIKSINVSKYIKLVHKL